jgi:hypothetical protein
MVHLLPAIKYPDINMAHINNPHNLSNVMKGGNEKVEYMTRNKGESCMQKAGSRTSLVSILVVPSSLR